MTSSMFCFNDVGSWFDHDDSRYFGLISRK